MGSGNSIKPSGYMCDHEIVVKDEMRLLVLSKRMLDLFSFVFWSPADHCSISIHRTFFFWTWSVVLWTRLIVYPQTVTISQHSKILRYHRFWESSLFLRTYINTPWQLSLLHSQQWLSSIPHWSPTEVKAANESFTKAFQNWLYTTLLTLAKSCSSLELPVSQE